MSKEKIVPAQKRGNETGASHAIKLKTQREAHALFMTARKHLLTINRWADYCKIPIVETLLTDYKGNKIRRKPKVGDYIRMDVVGPGPRSGDGYDWVRIEEIINNVSSRSRREFFAFRVRPAAKPHSRSNETSHFYTSDATSSFIIERKGNTVTASEAGRNEIPNTHANNLTDKIRNVLFAAGGMMGLAYAQWKLLMKGILTTED